MAMIGAGAGVLLLAALLFQFRRKIVRLWKLTLSLVMVPVVFTAVVLIAKFREPLSAFAGRVLGRIAGAWSLSWAFAAVVLALASVATAVAISSSDEKEDMPPPKFSRVPALCWIGAILCAMVAYLPKFGEAPWLISAMMALAVLWLIASCVMIVPRYHAGVVAMGDRPVRSVSSGWTLVYRPLGLTVEEVVEVHEVRTTSINDVIIQVEVGGVATPGTEKEPLNLEMTLEYKPNAVKYIQFQSVKQEKLEQILIDHLEGFATDEFKRVVSIQEAYDKLEEIETKILDLFHGIQDTYGVLVRSITIDDAAPDPKVIQAKIERQKKLNDAKLDVEIQAEINKKRQKEMAKIHQLALKMIKECEAAGQKLSYKEAVARVQVQFGIVKESKNTIDFGPGIQGAIGEVIPLFSRDRGPEKDPMGFGKKS